MHVGVLTQTNSKKFFYYDYKETMEIAKLIHLEVVDCCDFIFGNVLDLS